MNIRKMGLFFFIFPIIFSYACENTEPIANTSRSANGQLFTVVLPSPSFKGEKSLEECLFERRSVIEYSSLPLTLGEVSQLLWAGQGITAEWGGRTAPSAGGLYPLEVYIVAGNVANLDSGVYKYAAETHELVKVREGDLQKSLSEAALSQSWVEKGAINIVIAAVYERTTVKYGERGEMYVHMEAGHAAQNICLQAVSLDLGAVTIGAFHNDWIKELLYMSDNEVPLYIIPVGRR